MVNKQLAATVAICKELGWDRHSLDVLETLDLGTPEQKQIIKRGLSKGDWSGTVYEPSYRHIDYLEGIPAFRMILLAIRVGVAPKRVLQLLRVRPSNNDPRRNARLIAANGNDYAERFIKEAARFSETDDFFIFASEPNIISFYLHTQYLESSLAITEENYLKAWSVCAAHALALPGMEKQFDAEDFPTLAEIEPSLKTHLHAAFDLGMPMWTALGSVAVEAAYRGLVERKKVIAALLHSLDVVVRAGQRREVVKLLTAVLRITDEEICQHWELFAGILATAEPSLITAFGVRMIALATEEQLPELVLPMLYVPTLKGQKDVLKALAARANPSADTIAVLSDRVQELTEHKEATKLLAMWNVAPQVEPSAETLVEWKPAPAVWKLPRFQRGQATIESLTALLSSGSITERVRTLAEEDFYAQLVELALQDTDAACRFLAGLGNAYWWLPAFCEVSDDALLTPHWDQFWDRKNHLSYTLGKIPCLLSEPSFVDFSISLDDLLQRLDKYGAAGVPVMESDLHLALSRLRIEEIDVDSALRRNIPVSYGLREVLDRTAGQILVDYLHHPYEKPVLERSPSRSSWSAELVIQPATIPVPDSLGDIPPRLALAIEEGHLNPAAAPLWGDVVWTELAFDSRARADREGILAVQAAQSELPLEPGTAINLIGLCRPSKRNAHELAYEAVQLAWERGLLRPGVPAPELLGWKPQVTSFKGMAEVLLNLAQEGMLALSWQLLDDFLVLASKQASIPPGTSEVAEAMSTLVASVVADLENHAEAAAVPGLRFFAAKTGRSKVAVAAREAVKHLPQVESAAIVKSISLEKWAEPQPETINDTATVILEADSTRDNRLQVRLEIPDIVKSICVKDTVLQIWRIPYGLRRLLTHHEVDIWATKDNKYYGSFHMWWEDGQWLVKNNVRLTPKQQDLPMLDSIVHTLLAMIHTEPQAKTARDPFQTYLLENRISADSVAKAVATLARNPLWSPVRALKLLESDEFLTVLWPLLTQSIAAATEANTTPRWLTKVLDVSCRHADVLAAATTAGYIPVIAWRPLAAIGTKKAIELQQLLGFAIPTY